MKARALRLSAWLLATATLGRLASGAELAFRHHFIERDLPVTTNLVGDYGLTALADLDQDGDLDFVLGGRAIQPSQLYSFEFQAPDRWVRHSIGTDYLSDVGLAALDVDRDGWTDLVCSGVWYRNRAQAGAHTFERVVFDETAGGAHDILVADLDGDRKPDVVLMGDERTRLNSLRWYSIPADARQPWTPHPIGSPVHGAITPQGAADLDGDGDLDILRADTWFENKNGQGREWVPHPNLPMGRKGPYGVCVRTAAVDLDGDGRPEIVMADADIVDSKIAVLKNADGKGESWTKTDLPQSFSYGSLHALGVADFNQDGRPDIVANEQEELLPPGRENPRWIAWENLGGNRFAERILLDTKLGGHELQVGDVDGDGDVDICSKPWGPRPWNGNGGRMHVDFLENLVAADIPVKESRTRGVAPADETRPPRFPHRIWAACDFEARTPDYGWFGPAETRNIPPYPGNATALGVEPGPYRDVSAVMTGINPVPGPRMGKVNQLYLRYFLRGTTEATFQHFSLTSEDNNHIRATGLTEGRWSEVTLNFTRDGQRNDGTPGVPFQFGERMDDLKIFVGRPGERTRHDLVIDDVILFATDPELAPELELFPRRVIFLAAFDTGSTAAEKPKYWPGEFELVSRDLPADSYWNVARAVPQKGGKSKWMRLQIEPPRPVGTHTKLRFRCHLTGASEMTVQVFDLTDNDNRHVRLRDVKSGAWQTLYVDFTRDGRRNDGSQSAFAAGHRVDDLFFFVEPTGDREVDLLIDEVVLFDAGQR